MAEPITILCIDDEPLILKAYQRVFRDASRYCVSVAEFPLQLNFNSMLEFDVIICDQRMPGMQGTDIFKKLSYLGFQGKKIICSAFSDFTDITAAFNQQYIDYFLNKPWQNDEVRHLVEGVKVLPRDLGNRKLESEKLDGDNQAIERTYKLAKKAAKTSICVYVQGETGTGKEVLTRYIHDHSDRLNGPYVAVNCATLTTELFESLMFGHKKGAFTGAVEDHEGFYQAANGGTLFLDEVVDIPLNAQAKILRALQENNINRVGDNNNIEVDVRVISASSKPMECAVKDGEFREDLMYRLNVYPIVIPPLRERLNEIEPLFNHFLEKFNYHDDWKTFEYDEEVKALLLQYQWPGNIRELENVCNYLCATIEVPKVQVWDFPVNFSNENVSDGDTAVEASSLGIQQALDKCDGNKSKAAKLLGISRMTLWRHLKTL